MHPEEVIARNALLKQERALRLILDEIKRTGNYNLGMHKYDYWLDQTRQLVTENIGEIEGRKYMASRISYSDQRHPDTFFATKVKDVSETLTALRQNLQENGLSAFRTLPKLDGTGKFENEQLQTAHTALRERIHELMRYEVEHYADEDDYRRAYHRLIRWKRRTTEVLVEYVTQQEADSFAKEVGETDSVTDIFEGGKAFLNALLEELHAHPQQFFNTQDKLPREGRNMRKQSAKPRLFIGSSGEGMSIARLVQLELSHNVECVLWNQGPFGLSDGTLESLVRVKEDFDFAVLVLTPDDVTTKRGRSGNTPRDNVLFELGLFIGALGRSHTFMLYCSDDEMELPSDLAGVTAATYKKPSGKNLQAALGPPCTKILMAIQESRF